MIGRHGDPERRLAARASVAERSVANAWQGKGATDVRIGLGDVPPPVSPVIVPPAPFELLEELRAISGTRARGEPLQFQNLLTGSQYFPIHASIRPHLRPGLRALDWGSGNGHFAYFLLRSGLDVTAFNLESQGPGLASVLRARFPDQYRMHLGPDDEPSRLPFAEAAFDLVCSIGVLEHVRETGGSEAASLAEIRRVLRPGGHFLCAMLPNRQSWIEFLVRNLLPNRHWHRFRYTRAEGEALIANAGFEIMTVERHGVLPRNCLNARLLRPVHNRRLAARAYCALDRALLPVFGPVAQNFLLLARRPVPGGR